MKKLLFFLVLMMLILPVSAFADSEEDACGAILCLASPTKPSECKPYLAKYFSIRKFKHGIFSISRTIDARKDFLRICPNSDDMDLDRLANAIGNTLNQCDAENLNKRKLRYRREYDVLTGTGGDWELIARINDDYRGDAFVLEESWKKYGDCSQKQVDYHQELAAGRANGITYIDGEPYPFAPVCYEVREVVDHQPPKDCEELFKENYSYFDELKFVDGKWQDNN